MHEAGRLTPRQRHFRQKAATPVTALTGGVMYIHHSSTIVRCIAATLAIGLLAGCAPDGGPSAADAPLPQAQSPATDSPAVEDQAQARLPDRFPPQFPLPSDFEITHGSYAESDAMTQGGFLVRGHSATEIAELAAFFKQSLAEAGFEILQAAPVSPGANSALVYFRGGAFRDCSVQLSAAAEGTDVTISLPLDD